MLFIERELSSGQVIKLAGMYESQMVLALPNDRVDSVYMEHQSQVGPRMPFLASLMKPDAGSVSARHRNILY